MGADLHGLCTQSVQAAVERNKEASHVKVEMKDMVPCLKSVKPSAIKSILVDVPNVNINLFHIRYMKQIWIILINTMLSLGSLE